MCSAIQFSASEVQAQTFSELRNLAFYPVPLDTDASVGTSSSAPTSPTAGSDSSERIDMAMFEEVAISSYLKDIGEIERNAGSYAPELTQQLTSTGLLYQQQSRHEEAVTSFERAAASSRIHNGLYSPEQIVLAEHSINSLAALGRYDEVEDKYKQLLTIHRKVHGPGAAQTAQALLAYGQWQVERLHRNLAQPETGNSQSVSDPAGLVDGYEAYDHRFDALYQAQAHFVDALRILIEGEAWADPAIFALERNLIRTYYMDAYRARVIDVPLSYAADGESSHHRRRFMANRLAVPEQYLKGEQAYGRMIGYLKKNPDATLAGIADVMLGLADWHLLFGKHAEADEQYRQLEELMLLAGTAPAEAASILQPAVPVTLPAFHDSALAPKEIYAAPDAKGYVDVSFAVNRHGRAIDLDVLGTSDGTGSAVVDRLETLVRSAQFRPVTDARAGYT
ncbi:MAG: hypothetical protein ACTS5I_16490, partial [Rhodanobacter sp.]